nr:hypothetical protein [Legionella jordanis]
MNSKVLILGAGASVNYGYPTGKELIESILNSIENDFIYYPIHYKNINNVNYNLNDLISNTTQLGNLETLEEKSGNDLDAITKEDYVVS